MAAPGLGIPRAGKPPALLRSLLSAGGTDMFTRSGRLDTDTREAPSCFPTPGAARGNLKEFALPDQGYGTRPGPAGWICPSRTSSGRGPPAFCFCTSGRWGCYSAHPLHHGWRVSTRSEHSPWRCGSGRRKLNLGSFRRQPFESFHPVSSGPTHHGSRSNWQVDLALDIPVSGRLPSLRWHSMISRSRP